VKRTRTGSQVLARLSDAEAQAIREALQHTGIVAVIFFARESPALGRDCDCMTASVRTAMLEASHDTRLQAVRALAHILDIDLTRLPS
jgi:hypothetical protein